MSRAKTRRILLLTTGGTIASLASEQGLAPGMGAKEILRLLDERPPGVEFSAEEVLSLDSSNIQPEQWRVIARRTAGALREYDGVIITHGTDTMAYTAAALSFMLQNLRQSVVLTGSQLPAASPLSDARTNLYTAVEAVLHGVSGVSVAFNRKIIRGTRAVKVSTMGFDAFESVNAEPLGQIFADGTRVIRLGRAASGLPILRDSVCADVFLLKLLPGTKPEIFSAIADLGYRGVVLEAFGAGGLHFMGRDLLAGLKELEKRGIAVVVVSQCLYERCELDIYEVGRKILECGVIPGRDMTTEAASAKLMWALGQTADPARVRAMFDICFAGEVTL